jgi:chromatin remodeling complex protein RSC6
MARLSQSAPKSESVPKVESTELKAPKAPRAPKAPKVVDAAPAAAPVAPLPEVSSEKPKQKRQKEKKPAAEEHPVVVLHEVPAELPLLEAAVPSASSLSLKSVALNVKLNELILLVNSIKNDQKIIDKQIAKNEKQALKKLNKKRVGGDRAPSGFRKPALITDELATFLELPSGEKLARTEVTKKITEYIHNNNLQDPENGRTILPNKELSKLLNYSGEGELTYFNLQKYIKHLFIKSPVLID